jgi:hypothetical protein
MLKKIGNFEVGKAAGKNNQGILHPIEAVKIKNKQCIGEDEIIKIEKKKVESKEEALKKKLD